VILHDGQSATCFACLQDGRKPRAEESSFRQAKGCEDHLQRALRSFQPWHGVHHTYTSLVEDESNRKTRENLPGESLVRGTALIRLDYGSRFASSEVGGPMAVALIANRATNA
jgi:hypothetical protein